MPAFVVKHLVADHGSLTANLRDIRRTPYSFTSKHGEAHSAANGNLVYVVEVHRAKGSTTYRLGYKYRAFEVFKRPGTALWKDEFVYKNSAIPGDHAEGAYFESPVEVGDDELNAWLLGLPPGMSEIPAQFLPTFDALVDEPANGAKMFA